MVQGAPASHIDISFNQGVRPEPRLNPDIPPRQLVRKDAPMSEYELELLYLES